MLAWVLGVARAVDTEVPLRGGGPACMLALDDGAPASVEGSVQSLFPNTAARGWHATAHTLNYKPETLKVLTDTLGKLT